MCYTKDNMEEVSNNQILMNLLWAQIEETKARAEIAQHNVPSGSMHKTSHKTVADRSLWSIKTLSQRIRALKLWLTANRRLYMNLTWSNEYGVFVAANTSTFVSWLPTPWKYQTIQENDLSCNVDIIDLKEILLNTKFTFFQM